MTRRGEIDQLGIEMLINRSASVNEWQADTPTPPVPWHLRSSLRQGHQISLITSNI